MKLPVWIGALWALLAVSTAAADQKQPPANTAWASGAAEHDIERTSGVTDVVVGYTGGIRRHPTYESHGGHLEAIRVTYDPAKISYAALVDAFFHNIDPTDPQGQICDRGPSRACNLRRPAFV